MESTDSLFKRTLLDFHVKCRKHRLGTPHFVLLDKETGRPVGKFPFNIKISICEAIKSLLDFDIGLIPSSINAAVFDIDSTSVAPIEAIVSQHMSSFAALTPAYPSGQSRGYFWKTSEEARKVDGAPVHFRGYVVGTIKSANSVIWLSEPTLRALLDNSEFWSKPSCDISARDVFRLTYLE